MTALVLDENVPRRTTGILREAGLDVSHMAEVEPGATDSAVLERARSEGRLLATLDRDFGELIFRRGLAAPPGLIYLRIIPTAPDEPATLLLKLFAREEVELVGRFTVVTRNRVRQRPLP